MKKKTFLTAVVAMVMTTAMSMTAFAGSWQQNSTGWWYQNDDGTWPANIWQWNDGNGDGTAECYYFDGNGYMLVNTVTPDGYMVNGDGAWIVDGIVQMKQVGTDAKNSDELTGGNAGALLPGNAAVVNGSFDVAAYGYENHISKLLLDVPFMSREELAELLGGERKVKELDDYFGGSSKEKSGIIEVWYNGINDDDFSITFSNKITDDAYKAYHDGYSMLSREDYTRPHIDMPTKMAFDFYSDGYTVQKAFNYLVSNCGYVEQKYTKYTMADLNQIHPFGNNYDDFAIWVERNGKILMIECVSSSDTDTATFSRIVSIPGALR